MLLENQPAASKTQVSLKEMMSEYERALIVQALIGSAGHQRRAAAILGILPTTLHEKMKRLGIPTRTGLLREEYRKPGEVSSETAAA